MNVMSSSRALVKKGFIGPVRRYLPRIPGKAVQALPRAAQTQTQKTNKQTKHP